MKFSQIAITACISSAVLQVPALPVAKFPPTLVVRSLTAPNGQLENPGNDAGSSFTSHPGPSTHTESISSPRQGRGRSRSVPTLISPSALNAHFTSTTSRISRVGRSYSAPIWPSSSDWDSDPIATTDSSPSSIWSSPNSSRSSSLLAPSPISPLGVNLRELQRSHTGPPHRGRSDSMGSSSVSDGILASGRSGSPAPSGSELHRRSFDEDEGIIARCNPHSYGSNSELPASVPLEKRQPQPAASTPAFSDKSSLVTPSVVKRGLDIK